MGAVSKNSLNFPFFDPELGFSTPKCSNNEQQSVQKDDLDHFLESIYLPPPPAAKPKQTAYEPIAFELLERAASPVPELNWFEQLVLLKFIPTENRTPFTAKILETGQIIDFFRQLSQNDLSNPQIIAKIQTYAEKLRTFTPEILDVYSRNGTRAEFLISYLYNAALNGENAVTFRIDLNVTEMNYLDPTGNLGNEFLPYYGKKTHDRLTTPEAIALAERVPAVTHQPDRTSFVIAGPSNGKTLPFRNFLFNQLNEVNLGLGADLQQMFQTGRIGANVDIASFEPQGVMRVKTIYLRDLIAAEAAKRGIVASNPAAILPKEVVLDIIENQLKVLAAETTAVKTMPQMAPETVIGGLKVYTDASFEMFTDPQRVSMETFLGRGYVPFWTFIPEDANITPEQRAKLEFSDIAREINEVTSGNSKGEHGKLERFLLLAKEAVAEPQKFTPAKLAELKRAGAELGIALIEKGAEARRDARYPAMVNPDRNAGGEANDFFVEEIIKFEKASGTKYDALACVEVDNAKAFLIAYPVADKNDSSFQTIRKIIFETARDMGLPPIIVAAEGDQIRVAFATKTKDGRSISPTDFLAEVQSRIRNKYSDRKFQQFEKYVDESGQMKRRPLWSDPHGRVFGMETEPALALGYKRHVTGLTVTCSHSTMPDIYSEDGRKNANIKVGAMFKHIDGELKTQRGKHTKEGLGELPQKYFEMAMAENAILPTKARTLPFIKQSGKIALNSFGQVYDIGMTGMYGAASFLAAESLVQLILPQPTTAAGAALYNADVIGTSVVIDRGLQIAARQIVWHGSAFMPELAPFGAAEFFAGFGWASQVGKAAHDVAVRCGAGPKTAKYVSLGTAGATLATASKLGSKIANKLLKRGAPFVGQAYAAAEMADMGLHIVAGDTMTELDIRYQKKVDENFKYSIFGDGEAPWHVTTGRTFGYLSNLVTPSFISKGVDWLFYY